MLTKTDPTITQITKKSDDNCWLYAENEKFSTSGIIKIMEKLVKLNVTKDYLCFTMLTSLK